MNKDKSLIPIQKLTLKEKTEAWHKEVIDFYISKSTLYTDKTTRQLINYDLYNSIFDPKDLEYVTNPFKVDSGFPANPQNFNIIKPKIDLLLGEETKRPFNYKLIQTNEDAVSDMMKKKADMLKQTVLQMILQQSGEQPEEEVKTPEEIEKYFQHSYRDMGEVAGQAILEHLKEDLDLESEFIKGMKDALIGGEEVYYVGKVNGEPYCERVNTVEMSYDDADHDFIEDGDWAVRKMYMSAIAIADRFRDRLKDDDLDKILDSCKSVGHQKDASAVDYDTFSITFEKSDDGDQFTKEGLYTVYHVEFKSFRKIGFLNIYDQEGNFVDQEIVDETYEPSPTDEIEWEWIPEVREGYKIGTDVYIGMGIVEREPISFNRPYNHTLSYTGAKYNNTNTRSTSLVDVMKPLQYFYIILWYRLELALSRDKGRILNIDVTQIPKSMGIDVEKWMHYLSALGVNFINPYEEGWDISRNGHPASFNQFSSMDLSMSNVIDGYINLMAKIEDMVGELSGVSRQRQGSISTNELVGNVERAVVQSSYITEPIFWQHSQVKKRVLQKLLNVAKFVYAENERILHYITDDMARMFIKISKDLMFDDLSIYVQDSTKEHLNLQALKNLAQPALQNGVPLSEIAELITSDSSVFIKNKLKTLEAERANREQEMQKAQQEQQAQAESERNVLLKSELDRKNRELMVKEGGLVEEVRSNMAQEQIDREKISADKAKNEDKDNSKKTK